MDENAQRGRRTLQKLLITALIIALLAALREAAFARNRVRYGAPGQQNF